VNIYRKKMVNSKKRKVTQVEKSEISPPSPSAVSLTPTGAVTTRDGPIPYPVKLDYDEKPITFHPRPRTLVPTLNQPVVSPLMMYEMLYTYSDKEKEGMEPRVVFNPQMVPFAVMQQGPVPGGIHVPIYNKFVAPTPTGVKHEPETKKAATFWNFDAYPGAVTGVPTVTTTHQLFPPLAATDESWLESIFDNNIFTAEPVELDINSLEHLYSQEINLERHF